MRNLMLSWLVGLALAGAAGGEPDPDLPIEYVPFQAANQVEAHLAVRVDYAPLSDRFTFVYDLRSGPASRQPVFSFSIGTSGPIEQSTVPLPWTGYLGLERLAAPDAFTCMPDQVADMLAPGHALPGVTLVTPAAAAIGLSYVRGDVVPLSGQQVELPPPPGYSADWDQDCVRLKTVVPKAPPEPFQAAAFASFLLAQAREAATLGWIQGTELATGLERAQLQLNAGQLAEARATLQSLLAIVEASRGAGLTEEGYYLLKPDLEFLLDKLAPASSSLEIQTKVLSKHVQPQTGRQVQVEVTSNTTPIHYGFSVYRVADRPLPGPLGERVYQQELDRADGRHTFTWSGLAQNGSQVGNGAYTLVITARDGLLRESQASVKVEVNFPPGRRSALPWIGLLSLLGGALLGARGLARTRSARPQVAAPA